MAFRPSAGRRLLALVVVALTVVACTGGDDDDARPGEPSSTTTGDPVAGGVLRLGLPRTASVDPAKLSPASHTALVLADLLFDGLTAPGEPGQALPALATDWSSSRSATRWTFSLDANRRLSNGKPITGADVKRTLERLAKLGDASFAGVRLDVIDGYDELVTGGSDTLKGVRASRNRVSITLDKPMSTLPLLLASPLYGVVARGNAEDGFDGAIVTSGSYAVTERTAEAIQLERVRSAPGYVDGIAVRFFDDAAKAYDALESGDVDWAPVPQDKVSDAIDEYGQHAFAPFHAELFLGMNLEAKPFAKTAYRQAILAAIDRHAVVDAVYAATADPLDGVVPAGVPGYDPDVCGSFCTHDVDRAKRLVEKAYPKGGPPRVLIDVDDSDAQKAMARLIADDLRAAGIPARVRTHPFKQYTRFAASGDQQLFSFGWIGLYEAPDAYLNPLFTSGGLDNVTGFADSKVNHRLSTARKTTDPGDRAALWRQAEQRVLELAPIVPIAQFRTQVAVAKDVHGVASRTDGTFDFSVVWVEGGGS